MSDPDPSGSRRFVVDEASVGDRLDVVLATLLGSSRTQAATRIRDGDVTVDGQPRPRSHRMVGGETVVVAAVEEPIPTPAPPMPPVLHRDDDLLVIDKPAGLVVHPGHGHPDGTLVDALRAGGVPLAGGEDHRRGIVHRLDKDTSGTMLVACSEDAFTGLVAALRDRTVTRSYVALVDGTLPAPSGTIDVPLGRDPRDRTRFAADADGRHAVTHFAVQATGQRPDGRPVQLVACRLETGRTHQIRVHLAHAGTRVSGDTSYGASAAGAASLGLERPFLHALHLRLVHPVTGHDLGVEAPLPDDLVAVLAAAGIDPSVASAAAIEWPADVR